MIEFFITFFLLMTIILLMSIGYIFMGKKIKGSCGGLNAISDGDKCSICNKDVDPQSPLINKLNCKNIIN